MGNGSNQAKSSLTQMRRIFLPPVKTLEAVKSLARGLLGIIMSPKKPPTPPDTGKILLAVATGWGPSSGGINAFNIDFCLALGRVLKGSARVFCLATSMDEGMRSEAAKQGVELLNVPVLNLDDPEGLLAVTDELLQGAGIDHLDLIIGHDVLTGPFANVLRSRFKTKSVLIHHMSYGSYQSVKKDGKTVRVMENEQRKVLREADFVCAVGPLLRRSAQSLRQENVQMIVPGLADIKEVIFREKCFRAIAFGRLGGRDDLIKQGSLAAASYGRFVRKAANLNLSHDYRFNLFGLADQTYEVEEKSLRELVNTEAGRPLNVVACPYTESRDELFTALSENEVAMMLSWHEGFGLVGWEAIAACVPLVVSKRSGLYELLRDGPETFGADCVHAIDVRGSEKGTLNEDDVEDVAKTLLQLASNLNDAIAKARKVRTHLKAIYTWDRFASEVLNACGWGDSIATSVVEASRNDPIEGHQEASPVIYFDDICRASLESVEAAITEIDRAAPQFVWHSQIRGAMAEVEAMSAEADARLKRLVARGATWSNNSRQAFSKWLFRSAFGIPEILSDHH